MLSESREKPGQAPYFLFLGKRVHHAGSYPELLRTSGSRALAFSARCRFPGFPPCAHASTRPSRFPIKQESSTPGRVSAGSHGQCFPVRGLLPRCETPLNCSCDRGCLGEHRDRREVIPVFLSMLGSHHGVDELASGHNLGVGPCGGKMLRIAGDQIMRCSSLCAFQKNVIIGIRTGAHPLGGEQRFLTPFHLPPDWAQKPVALTHEVA